MKISVFLVKIDGAFDNRVFFAKTVAAKYAMKIAGDKPWEVIQFDEADAVAKGTGLKAESKFRCRIIWQ